MGAVNEYSSKPSIEMAENKASSTNIESDAADFRDFTPEEEAAVIRKLDYRLLPLLFVLYSLSVLDRSNLGNAKLAGLQDDVKLDGGRYAWLGTVFYISCEFWLFCPAVKSRLHAATVTRTREACHRHLSLTCFRQTSSSNGQQ
jgi:hypothetical protein